MKLLTVLMIKVNPNQFEKSSPKPLHFIFKGRQSDKFGNTAQWWTEETLEKYQVRAKCFID
jgi:hypothetical protein